MTEAQSSDKLECLRQQFGSMRTSRGTYESKWQREARYGSPNDMIFTSSLTPGETNKDQQYDSRAELALDESSSFFKGGTTPDGQRWHGLEADDVNEDDNKANNLILQGVEKSLFKYRYLPRANFSPARYEAVRTMKGFGTGIMYIGKGDTREVPIRYRHCHLSQCYATIDNYDVVNGMFYVRGMSPMQIIKEYGEDNVSDIIKEKASQKSTRGDQSDNTLIDVVNAVIENNSFDPDGLNIKDARYSSYHFVLGGTSEDKFLRESGYHTFPYAVVRDRHTPNEIYGRGTLGRVLPEILQLNQMKRTHIKAGHNAVDPITLITEGGSINPAHLRAGGIVRGGVDSQGRQTVVSLNKGERPDISDSLMEQSNEIIERAFHLNVYISNALRDTNRERVTATEVNSIKQDQDRIIGPQAARDEVEFLGPMVEREIDILAEWGGFLPDELEEIDFKIVYRGVLAMARNSDQVIAVNQYIESVIGMASVDPTIIHAANFYEASKVIGEANGTPAQVMPSREEFEQRVSAEQQQQAQQSLVENAGGLSQAADTLLGGGSLESGV